MKYSISCIETICVAASIKWLIICRYLKQCVSMILPALIETGLFPLKMRYLPCHARIVLLWFVVSRLYHTLFMDFCFSITYGLRDSLADTGSVLHANVSLAIGTTPIYKGRAVFYIYLSTDPDYLHKWATSALISEHGYAIQLHIRKTMGCTHTSMTQRQRRVWN